MIKKDTRQSGGRSAHTPPPVSSSKTPIRFAWSFVPETTPRATHSEIELAFWDARINGKLNHKRKV